MVRRDLMPVGSRPDVRRATAGVRGRVASALLPAGYSVAAEAMPSHAENTYEVAWLGTLSTTGAASPVLTADEQARVRALRDRAGDARVRARAAAVATANSIA